MKTTIELLKKSLQACADAHGADFCDWSGEECQLAVKSETVPVVNDVRMICEALYGRSSMVETGWSYTTVYLDEAPFLEDVDETLLSLALPKTFSLVAE